MHGPFRRGKGPPPSRRPSIDTYVNELIWREFYLQVLWHWPRVLDSDFNPDYRDVRWYEPGADFDAWRRGETGFPIVDAAMRQLSATGFMHNRLRMITAMFLTKDLHIHWKAGESHFMRHLVDGDIASNNGGWQWSAGTGADAAPYFRIQNPWTQSARFDPKGEFIKAWVPELRDVHPALLSTPAQPGRRICGEVPAADRGPREGTGDDAHVVPAVRNGTYGTDGTYGTICADSSLSRPAS